jgi:hypothetical protein|tara:strand:+ start:284 stop:400 length:117 start_codon:yes stop_codon:yes gene_type:complete
MWGNTNEKESVPCRVAPYDEGNEKSLWAKKSAPPPQGF